jgi:hypothetical protein
MTPSIIIAVLAATGIWAATASIIAHNRGRDYNTMAERHNSVVEELSAKTLKLTKERGQWNEERKEIERVYIAALELSNERLERIFQLTAERDQLQTKLNAIGVIRDPKTGRFVNPTRLLCDEVKSNASEEAFDDMMGNPMQQLNGLTVKQKSSSNG